MRKASILFVIIISFFVGISFYVLDPIVAWYIDRQISKVDFLNDNFDYEDLNVDYTNRSMYLSQFKYKLKDSDVWVEASKLTFKGVDFSEITKNKRLNVDSLLVENAKVNYNRKNKKAKVVEPPSELNPFPINIGSVEFVNSELCVQLDSLRESCFKNFNLIANDVFMNDFHEDESFTYSNFKCNAESVNYADHIMELIGGEVYLSSKDSVSVKNVQISNAKNAPEFQKFNIKIKDVSAQLSVSPLIKKEELRATNIQLDSFIMDIFYDKSADQPSKSLLPVSAIKALPFQLSVDQITMNKGKIKYTEKQTKSTAPITVYFEDVEASLNNISNDSIELQDNKTLSLIASARLLNQSDVELKVEFDHKNDPDAHRVYGSFSSFDLTNMNSLFKEMALLEFKTGKLDKLSFDFNVFKSHTSGKVDFRYSDLKLLTYKKDENNKLKKRSFFRNLITNTFAVRTHNPNGNRLINGTVSLKNDPNKTVFNYWWSAIYDGFEDTINR